MIFRTGISFAIGVLVTVISLNYAGSTAVIGRGACPTPATQRRFNFTQFMGSWYEYESFDRGPTVCVAAYYLPNPDGSMDVTNEGLYETKGQGNAVQRTLISIPGKVYTPDPAKPAELKLIFQGDNDRSRKPNYIVLTTDYVNYAVIFSCTPIHGRNANIQGSWIMTRKRGVAPANLAAIKESLKTSGIAVNRFAVANQSNCPATSGPQKAPANGQPTNATPV